LWNEIIAEAANDYPDATTDTDLVDTVTTRMVLEPKTLDVLVATNLHADILSDLAAALSRNLNPERAFPSMFKPIHGSTPDIAGKGITNPIAAVWSAAMMLEHLGKADAAARLITAIENVISAGEAMIPDLGGTATTEQVADTICEILVTGGT